VSTIRWLCLLTIVSLHSAHAETCADAGPTAFYISVPDWRDDMALLLPKLKITGGNLSGPRHFHIALDRRSVAETFCLNVQIPPPPSGTYFLLFFGIPHPPRSLYAGDIHVHQDRAFPLRLDARDFGAPDARQDNVGRDRAPSPPPSSDETPSSRRPPGNAK
jgi:hypothetical protein